MITVERATLVVGVLTLLVAFFQLRAANQALDANNAFLVESTLLELAIDALETVQSAGRGEAQQAEIDNAFLRYEAALVAAKSLEDKGGLTHTAWVAILETQCGIFEGNFDYLPDFQKECAAR